MNISSWYIILLLLLDLMGFGPRVSVIFCCHTFHVIKKKGIKSIHLFFGNSVVLCYHQLVLQSTMMSRRRVEGKGKGREGMDESTFLSGAVLRANQIRSDT